MFPDNINIGNTIVFFHPNNGEIVSGTVLDFFRGPIPGMSWVSIEMDEDGSEFRLSGAVLKAQPDTIQECYDPMVEAAGWDNKVSLPNNVIVFPTVAGVH